MSEPNRLKLVFSAGVGTGPQNVIFGTPGGYPRLSGCVLRLFWRTALQKKWCEALSLQLRRTRLAVRDWYVIGAFVGWVCDWYVIGALATSKEIGLNNDTWVCKNNANCYVLELCC